MRDNPKKILGAVILIIVLVTAVSVLLPMHSGSTIQQEVAATRQSLRQQGFKTDLSDFNLRTDPSASARAMALTFPGFYASSPGAGDQFDLLPLVNDGSAIVVWKQDSVQSAEGPVAWQDVRDSLDSIRPQLDAACEAAISGPIQFDLSASRGGAMLLPHLAPLRRLSQTLGQNIIAELHDGHPDAVWTNLFALTRLVTAWKVEPAEVSHRVRFAMVTVAFDATWQALQYDHWPDDKLAALQREWESADFLTSLPDTVAFRRASEVNLCQQQRGQPGAGGPPLPIILRESLRAPGSAISAIKRSWELARYRTYGTYDDEKNVLLFYQKREIETRNVIAVPTWAQMRSMPGVTNPPVFSSAYRGSRLSLMGRAASMSARMGQAGLPSHAAFVESQRRILIAAIALARFHQQHGAYSETIAQLAPAFGHSIPLDFMDGQPLRYQLGADGHFLLYGIGLDCIDHGGTTGTHAAGGTRRRYGTFSGPASSRFGGPINDDDIVWPKPAAAELVAAQRQQELNAARARADALESTQAAAQWNNSSSRQAALPILLDAAPITNIPDINFHGHPLSGLIRNPQTGANVLSLVDMLTLKPVVTGDEPETVTFELPIAYDVMTNIGSVNLYIDPTNYDDSDMGCNVMQMECKRATNGDCLLAWDTLYEAPGRHVLQAAITLNETPALPPALSPSRVPSPLTPAAMQELDGPLLPVTLTNLCQFSIGSARFEPALGAMWHARLPEANCSYTVELQTTDGTLLKTITGNTSTGELKVYWDLVYDHDKRFDGEQFNSIFHLNFPDSGKKQTLRGP